MVNPSLCQTARAQATSPGAGDWPLWQTPGQVQLGVLMDTEYLCSLLAFYEPKMYSSGKSPIQSKGMVSSAAVKRKVAKKQI